MTMHTNLNNGTECDVLEGLKTINDERGGKNGELGL